MLARYQGFKFRKHCSQIDKTKFAGIRCGWNSCLEIGIELSPDYEPLIKERTSQMVLWDWS